MGQFNILGGFEVLVILVKFENHCIKYRDDQQSSHQFHDSSILWSGYLVPFQTLFNSMFEMKFQ